MWSDDYEGNGNAGGNSDGYEGGWEGTSAAYAVPCEIRRTSLGGGVICARCGDNCECTVCLAG
jgi:hypothetical protein